MNRKSIRLKSWDYSQNGTYFITICSKNRDRIFGNIIDGKMILNKLGNITESCWLNIPIHFPDVILDEFIIMPNHIHGIIIINKQHVGVHNVGVQNFEPLQNQYQHIIPRSIGSIIRGFKIGTKKLSCEYGYTNDIWQRNYYEQIIRNEKSFNIIKRYIKNNPQNWDKVEVQNFESYSNFSPFQSSL